MGSRELYSRWELQRFLQRTVRSLPTALFGLVIAYVSDRWRFQILCFGGVLHGPHRFGEFSSTDEVYSLVVNEPPPPTPAFTSPAPSPSPSPLPFLTPSASPPPKHTVAITLRTASPAPPAVVAAAARLQAASPSPATTTAASSVATSAAASPASVSGSVASASTSLSSSSVVPTNMWCLRPELRTTCDQTSSGLGAVASLNHAVMFGGTTGAAFGAFPTLRVDYVSFGRVEKMRRSRWIATRNAYTNCMPSAPHGPYAVHNDSAAATATATATATPDALSSGPPTRQHSSDEKVAARSLEDDIPDLKAADTAAAAPSAGSGEGKSPPLSAAPEIPFSVLQANGFDEFRDGLVPVQSERARMIGQYDAAARLWLLAPPVRIARSHFGYCAVVSTADTRDDAAVNKPGTLVGRAGSDGRADTVYMFGGCTREALRPGTTPIVTPLASVESWSVRDWVTAKRRAKLAVKWRLRRAMPEERNGCGAASVGQRIFIVGGETIGAVLASALCYDVRTDAYLTPSPPPMRVPRAFGAVVSVVLSRNNSADPNRDDEPFGVVVAIGGRDFTRVLNSVEAYAPPPPPPSPAQPPVSPPAAAALAPASPLVSTAAATGVVAPLTSAAGPKTAGQPKSPQLLPAANCMPPPSAIKPHAAPTSLLAVAGGGAANFKSLPLQAAANGLIPLLSGHSAAATATAVPRASTAHDRPTSVPAPAVASAPSSPSGAATGSPAFGGQWVDLPPLRTGRYDFACTAIGSVVYVLGGRRALRGENNTLDSVECIDLQHFVPQILAAQHTNATATATVTPGSAASATAAPAAAASANGNGAGPGAAVMGWQSVEPMPHPRTGFCAIAIRDPLQ